MKPTAIRTAALCFATIFGILVTNSFWMIFTGFTEKGTGSFGMCEGTGFGSFSLYRSHDGEDLSWSTIRFESTDDAVECFQSTAYKPYTTESETIYDSERKYVGEKIILLEPTTQVGEIMVLEGNRINIFRSSSLKHALIFEAKSGVSNFASQISSSQYLK